MVNVVWRPEWTPTPDIEIGAAIVVCIVDMWDAPDIFPASFTVKTPPRQ